MLECYNEQSPRLGSLSRMCKVVDAKLFSRPPIPRLTSPISQSVFIHSGTPYKTREVVQVLEWYTICTSLLDMVKKNGSHLAFAKGSSRDRIPSLL